MIMDVELDDTIYDNLDLIAKERGVTVREAIRWIVGEYIRYHIPPPTVISPSPSLELINKQDKLMEMMMKGLINEGLFKCPECTMKLTMEAIEQGKCLNCGAGI